MDKELIIKIITINLIIIIMFIIVVNLAMLQNGKIKVPLLVQTLNRALNIIHTIKKQ